MSKDRIQRGYVLSLLAVVYVFNFADRTILSILLQPIKEELVLSDTQLGLLSGIAFALFYVTLGVPIARLADQYNRVNIISASVFLWSLMTVLCGFAANFVLLLLARIGVGVGEAGCTPPAHSLLSDYFSAEKRSEALGIYSLGLPVGSFLGLLVGGWAAELYGWRVAFMLVGAPGIMLAIIVKMTVREPVRGHADGISTDQEPPPPIHDVLNFLWSNRTFRQITLGTSLLAFASFATASWIPPFLIRSHGMGLGELGTWLALLTVAGGVTGALGGGFIGGKLARHDPRWYVYLPAIAQIVAVPFMIAGLLVSNVYLALALWFLPTVAIYTYVGPVMALLQRLVYVRMRAISVAVFFFFTNLIGMGAGPLVIGFISDHTQQYFGDESLRYSLMLGSVFMIWSCLHFSLASKPLTNDLDPAEAAKS